MTRKQKMKQVVCPICGGSHELPVGYQITNHKNVSVCLGILTRRAEAAEAAARRESNTAGELLAVIARIGETLGIAMSTPNLCRVVQAEVETVKARAEAAEAERDDWQAIHADNEMYGLALIGTRNALAARVAELEAETTRLRQELEVQQGRVKTLLNRNSAQAARMRARMARAEAAEARVAELEAVLAAQQWRPVTEAPPAPGRYMVVSRTGDITTDLYLFGRWQVLDTYIMHWRPIPPLPAPDAQETTQ